MAIGTAKKTRATAPSEALPFQGPSAPALRPHNGDRKGALVSAIIIVPSSMPSLANSPSLPSTDGRLHNSRAATEELPTHGPGESGALKSDNLPALPLRNSHTPPTRLLPTSVAHHDSAEVCAQVLGVYRRRNAHFHQEPDRQVAKPESVNEAWRS